MRIAHLGKGDHKVARKNRRTTHRPGVKLSKRSEHYVLRPAVSTTSRWIDWWHEHVKPNVFGMFHFPDKSRMREPSHKSDRTINSLCVCTGYDRRDHDSSFIFFEQKLFFFHWLVLIRIIWRPFWKWRRSPHRVVIYCVVSWVMRIEWSHHHFFLPVVPDYFVHFVADSRLNSSKQNKTSYKLDKAQYFQIKLLATILIFAR